MVVVSRVVTRHSSVRRPKERRTSNVAACIAYPLLHITYMTLCTTDDNFTANELVFVSYFFLIWVISNPTEQGFNEISGVHRKTWVI